jgi:hypothetical protein
MSAARIALGYEAHAPGRLTLVPIGLMFEARKRFRGRVLVSFGEPVAVSPHLGVYREEPMKALHALTTAIQWAMEREVVRVERIGRHPEPLECALERDRCLWCHGDDAVARRKWLFILAKNPVRGGSRGGGQTSGSWEFCFDELPPSSIL